MTRTEIIQARDKPAGAGVDDELAWILARILRWENPRGDVGTFYLPPWLTLHARDALKRYVDALPQGPDV